MSFGMQAHLKRLHFEAAAIVMAELKSRAMDTTPDGARKLPLAEKAARFFLFFFFSFFFRFFFFSFFLFLLFFLFSFFSVLSFLTTLVATRRRRCLLRSAWVNIMPVRLLLVISGILAGGIPGFRMELLLLLSPDVAH